MISELCIDVINCFKQLRLCLTAVTEHVCILDRNLPAWFQAPTQLGLNLQMAYREQACALLNQLEYLDGQAPREILVGAGIIAASSETLVAIDNLNIAKQNFKKAMLKLKAAKITPTNELLLQSFEDLLQQRDVALATSMVRMGLARIHLKQCYRMVPTYNQKPRKVSWTWANTRSIKRITISEATEMLIKQNRDAGIEKQLQLLQGLDPNEPLAIIQELAPHLRANLVFTTADVDRRTMVKGPVPIFYLADGDLELPKFNPPGSKRGKDKDRIVRKDVKINPEVFLPAIRAHRYLTGITS